jgi:soluble lytic murein transglycosylase-like protein
LIRIGALAFSLCAGIAATGAQAEALADAAPLAGLVSEASRRFALPERWIWAVLRAESAFDPRAVSRAGAVGLMQIMPATYAELARRHALGPDPFAARDNVAAGAAYLRELYDRFGAPGFLAAYNAGPDRYLALLATGRPLPAETRAYVARLAPAIAAMGPYARATPTEAAPSIFARLGDARDGVPAASDQLFVAVSRSEETP